MTVLALELDSSHCCHLALACQFQKKLRGESRGKKVTTFKVKRFLRSAAPLSGLCEYTYV